MLIRRGKALRLIQCRAFSSDISYEEKLKQEKLESDDIIKEKAE
jgi:hypothetical protein